MFVNVIKAYRDVVAVCDKEILGKKFEQGKFQLDIKESFYRGKQISEEEVIEIMKFHSKEDATFNIVGENSINAALKAGIISEDSVGRIQNVPFALILL